MLDEGKSIGILKAEPEPFWFACDNIVLLELNRNNSVEDKVALTPSEARLIVASGLSVFAQKGAGKAAGFSDAEYVDAGAVILNSNADVIASADVIVKSGHLTGEELSALSEKNTVFATIDPARNKALIDALIEKGVTSFASEMTQSTYPVGCCCSYDLGWEGLFYASRDRVSQYLSVLNEELCSACAEDGYLRRSLITYDGFLTNEETSCRQNRPWISPEVLLGLKGRILDQAPEFSTVRSKNLYPQFEND